MNPPPDDDKRLQAPYGMDAAPNPTVTSTPTASARVANLSNVSTNDLLMRYARNNSASVVAACFEELRTREPYKGMSEDEAAGEAENEGERLYLEDRVRQNEAAPDTDTDTDAEEEVVTLLPPAKMFAALVAETASNQIPGHVRIAYENALSKLPEYEAAEGESFLETLHRKVGEHREALEHLRNSGPYDFLADVETHQLLMGYAESMDDGYISAAEAELRKREPFNAIEDDDEATSAMMEKGNELLGQSDQAEEAEKAARKKAKAKTPKKKTYPAPKLSRAEQALAARESKKAEARPEPVGASPPVTATSATTATPATKVVAVVADVAMVAGVASASESGPVADVALVADEPQSKEERLKFEALALAEGLSMADIDTLNFFNQPLTRNEREAERLKHKALSGEITDDDLPDDDIEESDIAEDDFAEFEEDEHFIKAARACMKYIKLEEITFRYDGRFHDRNTLAADASYEESAEAEEISLTELRRRLRSLIRRYKLKLSKQGLDDLLTGWQINERRKRRKIIAAKLMLPKGVKGDLKPYVDLLVDFAKVRFPSEPPRFVAAVILEVIWQTKRKFGKKPVRRPYFFLLEGPQDTGKSTLWQDIFSVLDDLCRTNVALSELTSGKNQQIWSFPVLILDEVHNDKNNLKERAAIKNIVTNEERNFRPYFTRDNETISARTVLTGSLNEPTKETFGDPTGMRRFIRLMIAPQAIETWPEGREATQKLKDALPAIWQNMPLAFTEVEDEKARLGPIKWLDQDALRKAKQEELKPEGKLSPMDEFVLRFDPNSAKAKRFSNKGWISATDLHEHFYDPFMVGRGIVPPPSVKEMSSKLQAMFKADNTGSAFAFKERNRGSYYYYRRHQLQYSALAADETKRPDPDADAFDGKRTSPPSP